MQRDRPLNRILDSIVPGFLLSFTICFGCLSCGQETAQNDLPGEEINCEWFDKPSNCWRSTLDAISPFLPDENTVGSLSVDGKRCAYDDGTEITFTNPIDTTNLDDPDALRGFAWDFEIRKGGDPVATYREPDQYTIILESSLGEFKLESISSSVVITCPSEDQYNVPIASLLSTCPPENLPAKKSTWDTDGVSFTLRGTGGSDILIFNCKTK